MMEGSPTKDPYDGQGVDFPMPEGLQLPDNTEDGDEVDMLATFKAHGGELCLIAVEGIPVKSKNNDQKPDGSDDSFEGSVERGL